MANYATLKAAISAAIRENGNNEITGNLLQQQLLAMVNSLGVGYQYIGIATPDTNPGTPDQKVFYLGSAGTYPNFGPAVIPSGSMGVFYYDTDWHVGLVAFSFGDGSITSEKLSSALLQKLFSDGFKYAGIATPFTNPGTPEQNVFYVASRTGIYSNFGGLEVANGEFVVLKYNGTWSKEVTGAATKAQLDELDGDINGTTPPVILATIPVTADLHLNNVNNTKTAVSIPSGIYNITFSNPNSVPNASVYAIYEDDTAENLGAFASIINPKTIGKNITHLGLYSSSGVCPYDGALVLTFTGAAQPTPGLKVQVAEIQTELANQGIVLDGVSEVVDGKGETLIVKKDAGTIKYFSTETNVFKKGKQYNINAVLTAVNSVFIGFSKISASAFDAENMIVVFNKSAIGTYDTSFVAPDPEVYPYYFLQSVGTGNSVTIKSASVAPLLSAAIRGKKVLMLGDSISQLPRTGNEVLLAGLPEYFAIKTDAEVIRGAVGGRQIRARRDVTSVSQITDINFSMATTDICKIVEQLVAGDFTLAKAGQTWLETNAPAAYDSYIDSVINGLENLDMSKVDILTIFGGTNDYANGVPLGDVDSDNVMFENGAWNYILEALSTAFPKLSVFIFTPIVKKPSGVWCEDPSTANAAGLLLKDYATNAMDSAKRFMIPSCDLYHTMGINQYNFYTYISADNTHPVAFGYESIAAKMASFICSNINR